jgi:hypothetical protein
MYRCIVQMIIMFGMVFLQSTILNGLVFGATPDLALIILIFCATMMVPSPVRRRVSSAAFSGSHHQFASRIPFIRSNIDRLCVRPGEGEDLHRCRPLSLPDGLPLPFSKVSSLSSSLQSQRDAGLKVFTTTFLIEAGANALFVAYYFSENTRVIDITGRTVCYDRF